MEREFLLAVLAGQRREIGYRHLRIEPRLGGGAAQDHRHSVVYRRESLRRVPRQQAYRLQRRLLEAAVVFVDGGQQQALGYREVEGLLRAVGGGPLVVTVAGHQAAVP